ncbi:hypothetical protein I8J29_18165 [Paenibacillus sp. MWE-103]|uniref:Uncharacterized protein n=1 Tax=Paenibacillus artemisiicola TaxID=1172618 RepID=A0ABS3WCV1_9BACL|nr:hypothetical protein [Paenibacillus artemisiicola]MBO7746139.1 hypothetical protein [Paenibacillus artemisiicola]
MYLDAITRHWQVFMNEAGYPEAADAKITNTAKLTGLDGACLLEFEKDGRRYHLYALPCGAPSGIPELHRLDEGYEPAGLAAVFGLGEARAAALGDAVGAFLRRHYDGMQTAVDAGQGLAHAKARIRAVRLARWRPAD